MQKKYVMLTPYINILSCTRKEKYIKRKQEFKPAYYKCSKRNTKYNKNWEMKKLISGYVISIKTTIHLLEKYVEFSRYTVGIILGSDTRVNKDTIGEWQEYYG